MSPVLARLCCCAEDALPVLRALPGPPSVPPVAALDASSRGGGSLTSSSKSSVRPKLLLTVRWCGASLPATRELLRLCSSEVESKSRLLLVLQLGRWCASFFYPLPTLSPTCDDGFFRLIRSNNFEWEFSQIPFRASARTLHEVNFLHLS